MIIVKPQVELLALLDNSSKLIEKAGRVCYKSEDKICEGSDDVLIGKLMNLKHESVLEHSFASFRFICDRGVTHEMVRHRVASFSQESTRYCNYGKGKFQGQIKVIEPPFKNPKLSKGAWEAGVAATEEAYMAMLEYGETPQIARSILPNCLKTEIVMSCNFREWLHVFKLRTNRAAHPQIIEVMEVAQQILKEKAPQVFNRPEKEKK